MTTSFKSAELNGASLTNFDLGQTPEQAEPMNGFESRPVKISLLHARRSFSTNMAGHVALNKEPAVGIVESHTITAGICDTSTFTRLLSPP